MSSVVITFTAPDEVITQSLDMFSKCHGWTEQSEVTQVEYARLKIRSFVLDSIKGYALQSGNKSVTQAVEAQVGTITKVSSLTLEVEPTKPT